MPILYANAFVSQFDKDGFIVTIGQMSPPALVGTPSEIKEQLEQIDYVHVQPLARLGLTRERMQELVTFLQTNLDQSEQAAKLAPGDPRDDD